MFPLIPPKNLNSGIPNDLAAALEQARDTARIAFAPKLLFPLVPSASIISFSIAYIS